MPRGPRLSQHELDDEFEKFLKESLSDADDSMDTGKLKKFFDPQKRAEEKQKKKADQPWWMDDDNDRQASGESRFKKQTPISTNKWLKPKKQSTPVIQEDTEDEDEEDTPGTGIGTHQMASRYTRGSEFSSNLKPSSDEARKLKPSISRDSLESSPTPRKDRPDYETDEFESDHEEQSTRQSTRRSFDEDLLSYTATSDGTTLRSTGPGAETMEELADKERFFRELEAKKGNGVDYSQLNKDVDMTGTMGTMGSLSPFMGTADEHSNPIARVLKSAESQDFSEETDEKSKDESSSKVSPATVKDTKKPSMLSKVALLDTVDSTMNVTKKDVSPGKGEGDAKIQAATSKGLTVNDTTDDMEALQAAMRNAADTPTLGLDDSSYGVVTQHTKKPEQISEPTEVPVPQARTVEDIIREIEEERKRKRAKEKEEEDKQKQEEEEQRREEELRKMENENKNETDSVDGGFRTKQGVKPSGFDLSPVPTQEGRGFNLSPVDEGRGFNLEPANEGRGFDLQPANEGRGFDLQTANERNVFDLQPASADDEASYGIMSKTSSKKETQKKSKGRYGNIKGSGYGKPKTKSSEVWSPATAAKHKVKGTEVPIPGRRGAAGANRNLVQSVESFATYIQEHFADARKLTPPPEARYSREEPIMSASMRESKIHHLSRERALVSEVTEWQNQWKDAHRLNAKLKAEMATHQREFARKEEELRLMHDKELFKVKQDNFVLQAKLNSEEEQKKVKNKAISGRSLEGTSEEEVKLMQKEIIEQETLLQGYQQENERLYREVKKLQTSNKDSEEVLFKENQKLQTELATVRELLEQKEVALRHKGIITGPKIQQDIAAGNTAVLGAGRIAELQGEIKDDKMKEIELKQQIRSLEQTIKELELHIETVARERNHSEEKRKNLRDVKQREFQDMQQQYKREIEGLQKKLRWYAENQELLDKDSHTLKEKDEEVKRLQDALEKANKHAGGKSQDAQRRAKERAADAKKIQDLERQVKEMNGIIRRRYPNSLPALIYAAASTSEGTQDPNPQSPHKSHTTAFLEQKVKQLEDELVDKGEEVKRSLRVMEQQYNLMRFQYEDRVQKLEKLLEENKPHQPTRPHTNVTAVERELQNVKEKYRRKLEEAQAENDELRKTLAKGKGGGRGKSGSGHVEEPNGREKQEMGFPAAELQDKLTSLARELSNKDNEIEMLRGVCDRLMQERLQAQPGEAEANKVTVSGTQSTKRSSSKGAKRPASGEIGLDSKQYKPQDFAGSHISDVIMENEHLKQQMESVSVEMEQQRLRVQAALAEAEGNVRKTKEAAAEEASAMKSRHVEEMDKLVAERALLHSDSHVAKLTNQVESQKVLINHLQEQLSDARIEVDVTAASRVREQLLKTQLNQLKGELDDAKKSHSPEMRHFEALHSKIAAMEARHSNREQELHLLVERAKHTATIEKDQEIAVYRVQLVKKNTEIQRFRVELDTILEILRELQRQGVVLPMKSGAVQSLL